MFKVSAVEWMSAHVAAEQSASSTTVEIMIEVQAACRRPFVQSLRLDTPISGNCPIEKYSNGINPLRAHASRGMRCERFERFRVERYAKTAVLVSNKVFFPSTECDACFSYFSLYGSLGKVLWAFFTYSYSLHGIWV